MSLLEQFVSCFPYSETLSNQLILHHVEVPYVIWGYLSCSPIRNHNAGSSISMCDPHLTPRPSGCAPHQAPPDCPLCLADCLLHEENFSVRCPKHKVSQPTELVLPAGLGGRGLLLTDLRTCYSVSGQGLVGGGANEREPCDVESALCGGGAGEKVFLSVKRNA